MDTPFVKCLKPLRLFDSRNNPIFVPCGHCIACQNTKRSSLSLKLRLEEHNCKFCYFLTLTFDDDNIPLFDVDFDSLNSNIVRIRPFSERLRTDSGIDDFCSDMYDGSSWFWDSVDYYKSFVANYERKYHKSCVYGHRFIALLYYRDIQLFLKRVRKFILANYGEKIRFYAIGEYGTKSLRPHWHLLFFFNSSELAQAFEDCENVGTTRRPCECPKFLRPFWEYGIIDSKRTNGECYNYVSSYVNKPSNFPKLLVLLSDQKAYHSIQLGQILSEKDIISNIKKDNFGFFEQQSYVDSYGFEIPYAIWRSYYNKYFPTFSCSGCMSLEQTYRVLTSYETLTGIVGSDSISDIARHLFYHYHKHCSDNHDIYRYLYFAYVSVLHSKNVGLLSCLKSVLYASKQFLSAARLCDCSPVEYFRKYLKFYRFKNLGVLRLHFDNCSDSLYRSIYYQTYSFHGLDSRYLATSEFADFTLSEKVRFVSSIKHRDEVALNNIDSNLI